VYYINLKANMTKTVPVLVRVSPQVKELLDKAKVDQRRSYSSLVDEAVKDSLSAKYAPVSDRITRFLGNR
jgi:hypothetical protein